MIFYLTPRTDSNRWAPAPHSGYDRLPARHQFPTLSRSHPFFKPIIHQLDGATSDLLGQPRHAACREVVARNRWGETAAPQIFHRYPNTRRRRPHLMTGTCRSHSHAWPTWELSTGQLLLGCSLPDMTILSFSIFSAVFFSPLFKNKLLKNIIIFLYIQKHKVLSFLDIIYLSM